MLPGRGDNGNALHSLAKHFQLPQTAVLTLTPPSKSELGPAWSDAVVSGDSAAGADDESFQLKHSAAKLRQLLRSLVRTRSARAQLALKARDVITTAGQTQCFSRPHSALWLSSRCASGIVGRSLLAQRSAARRCHLHQRQHRRVDARRRLEYARRSSKQRRCRL